MSDVIKKTRPSPPLRVCRFEAVGTYTQCLLDVVLCLQSPVERCSVLPRDIITRLGQFSKGRNVMNRKNVVNVYRYHIQAVKRSQAGLALLERDTRRRGKVMRLRRKRAKMETGRYCEQCVRENA